MSIAKVLFLNLTFVYDPKVIQFFILVPLPVYNRNPSSLAKTVGVASHVAVVQTTRTLARISYLLEKMPWTSSMNTSSIFTALDSLFITLKFYILFNYFHIKPRTDLFIRGTVNGVYNPYPLSYPHFVHYVHSTNILESFDLSKFIFFPYSWV
jgi:hypothetical protein